MAHTCCVPPYRSWLDLESRKGCILHWWDHPHVCFLLQAVMRHEANDTSMPAPMSPHAGLIAAGPCAFWGVSVLNFYRPRHHGLLMPELGGHGIWTAH